jgi:hypothetical protein
MAAPAAREIKQHAPRLTADQLDALARIVTGDILKLVQPHFPGILNEATPSEFFTAVAAAIDDTKSANPCFFALTLTTTLLKSGVLELPIAQALLNQAEELSHSPQQAFDELPRRK